MRASLKPRYQNGFEDHTENRNKNWGDFFTAATWHLTQAAVKSKSMKFVLGNKEHAQNEPWSLGFMEVHMTAK